MRFGRVHGWASLLDSVAKVLTRVVVLLLVLVTLAGVGWLIVSRDRQQQQAAAPAAPKPLPPPPTNWHAIDQRVAEAMKSARLTAEKAAEAKLAAWTDGLMRRVDDDFLNWYFGYWNQQWLGLKAIGYWSANQVFESRPTVAEQITEDVQAQFATRVLRPQIAQMELERITREVLEIYVAELSTGLEAVRGEYNIPRPAWERYLEDVALLTTATEADRSVPLSLKTLATGSGVGAVILVRKLSPMLTRMGTAATGRLAGGAAGSLASKTGAKVAARAGGKLAGPIIGIGVIVWDVWDHHRTKKIERPVLRQSIADYLGEVRQSLLHDPQTGIASTLHAIEGDVLKRVRETP